jgi:hypothetical protein
LITSVWSVGPYYSLFSYLLRLCQLLCDGRKNWRELCDLPKVPMVSSPVADLLAPKYNESYIEYKNAAGDTLSFRTFMRDGNKIVSLNGIELPVNELFDIIQEVETEGTVDNCDIALACAVGIAISFVAIMIYMRYVFSIAF